jgi:hypothetical protein
MVPRSDVHPGTVHDVKTAAHNAKSRYAAAQTDTTIPAMPATRRGQVENENTASAASRSIARQEYFDRPACRGAAT